MRAGTVIAARFELVEIAGAGGMGTVWRARDRLSGEHVAVKVLEGVGGDERFLREAAVLAELVHPRIVRYVAHGQTDVDGPRGPRVAGWLAMEWLEGESLAARLEGAPLSIGESLTLASLVASALGAAHARGIVHRDVKPSNILLCGGSAGDAKVVDFGIARRVQGAQRLTRTGVAIGTPAYMAPEQARGGREIDARADVFSLGCVLFECLTGRAPFVGEHELALLAKVLLDEPPRLATQVEGVPPALDDLVSRMLAKDPAHRPADGRSVALAIAALGPLDAESSGSVPALRRAHAAPTALTGGEQHVSTVLLVAGGGSRAATDLSRQSGPVADQATEIAPAPVVDLATRFAGRVEALADGAVVATFEHVRTPTDQAASAARCALALRGARTSSRMVLATGRSDSRAARPVGRAIDRAAKLLAAAARAEGGEPTPAAPPILLDEVTAALLEGAFDVAGVSSLDAAFGLRGERSDEVERTLLGRPTPLVGRDRELHTLEAILDESAGEGVARAAVVIGTAGVGKSRLRQELLRRVRRREPGVTVWSARAEPLAEPSPFGLVAPMLRQAAGIRDGDSAETRRERFMKWLARRVGSDDLERIAAGLGELVGVAVDGSPHASREHFDPVVAGDRLRRAWEDVVAAECAERPLLLVLEDLHWGDASSVAFMDHAMRNLSTSPLMVLALARPEVHERFPRLWESRSVEVMRLGGLMPRASARLVRAVLGESLGEDAVERLVARADGNAFYLEELIRAAAAGRGADEELPDTVLGMVEARLRELEPEARRVLRAASVLGQTFWPGAVHALLGGAERRGVVEDWLAALTDAEIVTRRGSGRFPGETEYAFRHALVREAAYAMLTAADRVLGHRLAAAWLERAGESDAMALAQHFVIGEEPSRAATWYERAAEQALAGHDFQGAVARAEHALACGVEGGARASVVCLMSIAHKWRGANLESARFAREAMALAAPGSDVWADAAGEAAISEGDLGHQQRMDELVGAVLPLWRSKRTPALAVAVTRLATQLDYVGDFARSSAMLAEVAAATDVLADVVVRASLELSMSMHHMCAGNTFESAVAMRGAAAALGAAGDDRRRFLARSNLGYLESELGRFEEAHEDFRHALEGCARMALDSVEAGALSNLGFLLAREGRLDEAERFERKAIAAYAAQYHPRMEAASRIYLARILAAQGSMGAAEAEAARAIELLEGTPPLRAYALATRAHLDLAGGRVADALAGARAAHDLLVSLGTIDDGEAFVRVTHAEALRAAGDMEGARAAIADAKRALLARADRISDADVRRSFLERVPDHARTLALAGAWST